MVKSTWPTPPGPAHMAPSYMIYYISLTIMAHQSLFCPPVSNQLTLWVQAGPKLECQGKSCSFKHRSMAVPVGHWHFYSRRKSSELQSGAGASLATYSPSSSSQWFLSVLLTESIFLNPHHRRRASLLMLSLYRWGN